MSAGHAPFAVEHRDYDAPRKQVGSRRLALAHGDGLDWLRRDGLDWLRRDGLDWLRRDGLNWPQDRVGDDLGAMSHGQGRLSVS
jgi:hypothetical protein